jgi:hypothetical protein
MWTQAAAMAVGTAMTAASVAGAQPHASESRPVLAVTVIDLASVPKMVLGRAAEDATSIYDLAGVELVWNTTRSTECDRPANGHWVRVVLYAGRESRELGERANAGRFTMGFAPCAGAATASCTIAYIFYDRIEEFAGEARLPVGRLLGLAIAHEIGHLLLPARSHSAHGIMRAALDLGRSILPQFTAVEAGVIRARVNQSK